MFFVVCVCLFSQVLIKIKNTERTICLFVQMSLMGAGTRSTLIQTIERGKGGEIENHRSRKKRQKIDFFFFKKGVILSNCNNHK